jgi:hypothetical protein
MLRGPSAVSIDQPVHEMSIRVNEADAAGFAALQITEKVE